MKKTLTIISTIINEIISTFLFFIGAILLINNFGFINFENLAFLSNIKELCGPYILYISIGVMVLALIYGIINICALKKVKNKSYIKSTGILTTIIFFDLIFLLAVVYYTIAFPGKLDKTASIVIMALFGVCILFYVIDMIIHNSKKVLNDQIENNKNVSDEMIKNKNTITASIKKEDEPVIVGIDNKPAKNKESIDFDNNKTKDIKSQKAKEILRPYSSEEIDQLIKKATVVQSLKVEKRSEIKKINQENLDSPMEQLSMEEQLEKLLAKRSSGEISQEEYAKLKKELIIKQSKL